MHNVSTTPEEYTYEVWLKYAWESSVNIRSLYSVRTTPGEYKYVVGSKSVEGILI